MDTETIDRPLSDEEIAELERQAAASSVGFDAFNPPTDRPMSDAEMGAVEMRGGAGTAIQQTPFGRATDPMAPQIEQEEQHPLSDDEMDRLVDETVRDPSYVPTFEEWNEWDAKRAARANHVEGFLRGAGSIAQALYGVGYSVLATPGNFVFQGFGPAYETLVHSSAEGMRRSGVGLAEMISWAGDVASDIERNNRRAGALDAQIKQRLAQENAFTGDPSFDNIILRNAISKAKEEGFYDLTDEQKAEDRKEKYNRFVRNRGLEQEFLGIGNFTMGNEAIETGRIFGPKTVGGQPSQITAESRTKADYGIDDSKVDEGIATGVMLVGDPSGWIPMGAGALTKVKALRRLAVLADKPMGWTAGTLGWAARKAEDIEARALSAGLTSDRLAKASAAVAVGSGVVGVSQNNDLAKGIALAATVLPTVKYSGKILRRAEGAALGGQMVVKEMGMGGVGVMRADSAARLSENAAIPGRYREAMRGFFAGPESSLKRASQNEALPLSARKTMARLDRTGITQAFRVADDAASGAISGTVVGVPFAAIAPEEQRDEIFGSIATMGALGGMVSGPMTRRAQMGDADVARMLADIEAVGGDAAAFAQLPHDRLVKMAAMQGVVSDKIDFVPLRADEYAANEVLKAKNATTTKGVYIDAEDGNRPRIFLNVDQLASGDVGGHEIGHAILKSDILGGEIKNNMRNLVNVQYGQDGVQARGREYARKLLANEVEQGVTGEMPSVLSDDEMQRVARGAKPEDIIRERWQDPVMRERMVNERIDEMNQRDMAKGGMEWDWARDEIAAETFSGLSSGIDFRRIREGGPLAGALGAFSGTLDMMGAKFRGNGRLDTPNRLFEENPLMDTPQMRKAVTDYTKAFDRYLAGMERDAAPKRRGTKVAPTGKASEAARSPHNRVYKNGNVTENDIFILDANGNPIPKSQQQINTQEKAREATLKSINTRTRFVPTHSSDWGARKVGNRVEVGGPNLPLQFDHFVQVPEWLRQKAREFEAGRKNGQSYRVSYNAIGTGASGSYKVSNLGNVEAITREVVPFGWQLSEKNHLLAKVIDLDAFRAAAIRAIDQGELPEFGNNVKQVEADLKVLLKNHEDGLPGETNLGVAKKNLLNGLLGTGTATQKAANPLYGDLNPKGSIRTFRFDRLNYADPYATGYFPHYHKINTNAMPREAGVMSLDEWRKFDADRKSVWLNNRAREAGYTNAENWRGSDDAGFRAADAQYRNEFPVPTQGGAAAMPGDATRGTRGQAMPDVTITPNEARARGLAGPYYHGSPDFKGRKFTREHLGRNTGLSRSGISFTDDVSAANAYALEPMDSAQAAVDAANGVMREVAEEMRKGLKVKDPVNEGRMLEDASELPEFNVRYIDDIDEFVAYADYIADSLPAKLRDKLKAAARTANERPNPVVAEVYLRNPSEMTDFNGKKLWLVRNPDDIFVSAAKPPEAATTGRTRGQAMPDVAEQIFGKPSEVDGAIKDWRIDRNSNLSVSLDEARGTYFVMAGEREFGPYSTAQDAADGLLEVGREAADAVRPQIERDAMRDSLSSAKTLRGEGGVAGVSFSRIKGSGKSNSMYMDVVIDFDPALGKRLYDAGVQDKRDTGNFYWDLDDDVGVIERATVSVRISDHADVSAFSKSTAAIQDFVTPSRRGDWLQAPDRVLADIEQRIGVSLPRPKIQKPDVSIGPLEAVASRLAAVRSKVKQ